MSDTVLHVHDLEVAYERQVVLHDIAFSVAAGESVALLGPNGAGKSTLFKAVLGLIPIQAGFVEVLGHAAADERRHIAYVPQHDQLDRRFPVTVEQVVLMGRYREIGWLRRPRPADRLAVTHALEAVDLASLAKRPFGDLSGGQRQRVLIARAIAQQARLLLLDEPFNGVDAVTQDLLIGVLNDLRGQGIAVVMATHDLSMAHLACGHACLLNRHVVHFGPIEGALSSEALAQTYGPNAVALAKGTAFVHAH
jgi:manganese/iron transport system ATP-binding protein